MPTHSGHTHTHTDTLLIYLGGVDNHKDLLNGAGRSSLYQALLYRPHDKWDCHDGWEWGAEGPTTRWIELKPRNEPRRQAELGCHLVWWNPEAVGVEMNGWMPSFSQHWIKTKGESVRGKVRYVLLVQEDDAWKRLKTSQFIPSQRLSRFIIDHPTICWPEIVSKLNCSILWLVLYNI